MCLRIKRPQRIDFVVKQVNPIGLIGAHREYVHDRSAHGVLTMFEHGFDRSIGSAGQASSHLGDIKPLAGLPITQLKVSDTSIQDITILKTMPLKIANLSYAPVKDISSLRDMKISELYIRGTRVNQLDPLRSLRSLKRLEVDQNTSTILEVLLALEDSDSIIVNDATAASLKHKFRSKLLQMKEN